MLSYKIEFLINRKAIRLEHFWPAFKDFLFLNQLADEFKISKADLLDKLELSKTDLELDLFVLYADAGERSHEPTHDGERALILKVFKYF